MKKVICWGVVLGLALGGIVAQAGAGGRPVSVFANFGVILNGFIIPNDLTLGLQVDIRPVKFLAVSPELNVWSNHYHFRDVTWAPGVVANIRLGDFFFGGGFAAMKGGGYGGPHRYQGNDAQGRGVWTEGWAIRPKFNLGLGFRNFKLAIGAIPIDDGIAGVLTAGVGF